MISSTKTVYPTSTFLSVAAHTALCVELEGACLRGATSARVQKHKAGKRFMRTALLLALVIATALWSARAQSTFGNIRGTVTDASGAVIPGATVSVHSLDQNFDRQATTTDAGEFLVENLQPGHYSVTVDHSGFSKAVVSDTQLLARQELRLPIT